MPPPSSSICSSPLETQKKTISSSHRFPAKPNMDRKQIFCPLQNPIDSSRRRCPNTASLEACRHTHFVSNTYIYIYTQSPGTQGGKIFCSNRTFFGFPRSLAGGLPPATPESAPAPRCGSAAPPPGGSAGRGPGAGPARAPAPPPGWGGGVGWVGCSWEVRVGLGGVGGAVA